MLFVLTIESINFWQSCILGVFSDVDKAKIAAQADCEDWEEILEWNEHWFDDSITTKLVAEQEFYKITKADLDA